MRARALLIVALVAPALLAGSLEKYKNWPGSPQGYFMTNAERAEWKASVRSDADAEAFVTKFLAARSVGFAEDVVQRAALADKHLTVSGRAGSSTTRGRIIILLGPPSSFSVAERTVRGSSSTASESSMGLNPASGPGVGDMAMAASRRDLATDHLKDYTFTYTADKLPGKQPKDLTVVVEVRAGDGTDRIADRKAAAQLDEIFEAAAQNSLAPRP